MMPAVGRSPRRLWWLLFLVLSGVCVAWMMTTPPSGSPDEGDHIVRAAGVDRGQIFAVKSTAENGTGGIQTVPASLAATRTIENCFAFIPVSAACGKPLPHSLAPTEIVTGAGRYYPPYYLVVGLPSLPWPNATGVYLMRLLSALMCAGLLASAFLSAFEWRRSRLLLAGLVVAITPEAFFLAGSVNPNSLEIAGMVSLWTTLLVLADRPFAHQVPRLVLRAGVAGVAVLGTRSLSPLWVVICVAVAVVMAGWSQVLALLRRADVLVAGALMAAVTIGNVVWTTAEGALDIGHSSAYAHYTFSQSLHLVRAFQGKMFDEMIGYFGWLVAKSPELTYVVWIVAIVVMVLLGLVFGGARQRILLVGVLAATYLIPIGIETRELPTFGLAWQGRYTLPLAAGVPLVAGFAAGRRLAFLKGWLGAGLAAVALAMVAVAQTGGFFWALGRAQTGTAQWPALIHGAWRPPGGPSVWIVLFGLSLGALYFLVWLGVTRPLPGRGTEVPASARALEDVEHERSQEELHA